MNTYLRAKHWQLFIALFVLPFIFQFTTILYVIGSGDLDTLFSAFKVFPFFMALFIIIYNGWFWAIGNGLKSRMPVSVKMNRKLFITSLTYPAIYIVVLMVVVRYFLNIVLTDGELDPEIFLYFLILIPFHFLSMICSVHSMYYVSKTIKAVELQREVTFTDFVAEFFLIWFFPIGIWILQPKINKLVENKNEDELDKVMV